MRRLGIGPWFGSLSLLTCAGIWAGETWLGWRLPLPEAALWPARALGAALFALGLHRYLQAMRTLIDAMKRGVLASGGPFARVRHPGYHAGLFLMTPGFCLMWGTYGMFMLPPIMLLILMGLIGAEEKKLLERFGDEYRDYQRRVGRLWPRRSDRPPNTG